MMLDKIMLKSVLKSNLKVDHIVERKISMVCRSIIPGWTIGCQVLFRLYQMQHDADRQIYLIGIFRVTYVDKRQFTDKSLIDSDNGGLPIFFCVS
jgi:hypothetical protein